MKPNEIERYSMTTYDGCCDVNEQISSHGEWVRHSDAIQAIQQAQIDMARMNREGDEAIIRAKNEEIERLKKQIKELEGK